MQIQPFAEHPEVVGDEEIVEQHVQNLTAHLE